MGGLQVEQTLTELKEMKPCGANSAAPEPREGDSGYTPPPAQGLPWKTLPLEGAQ